MDGEIFDEQDPIELYVPEQEHREKFIVDVRVPIGVLDSGIGGLTVVRELMCQVPDEYMVYFGDTVRLLYGAKSRGIIIRFLHQIVCFLKTKGVKAIMVACNAASSRALKTLTEKNEIPVIRVICTDALSTVRATKDGYIDAIGTHGTANSEIYPKVIQSISPGTRAFQKVCLMFVPLIEERLLHDSITDEMTACHPQELKEKHVGALVLGYTHYPLLRSTIGRVMGEEVTLANPAYKIATGLRDILARKKPLDPRDGNMESKYRFYVSDLAENFRDFADSILPTEHLEAKKIEIEECRREGES